MTTPDQPAPDTGATPPADDARAVAPEQVPAPEQSPIPAPAELERIAEPARVRRAPKFGAFITAGVLVGVVLALLAVLVLPGDPIEAAPGSGFVPFLEGRNGTITVLALLLGAIGALVGGWLAVLADRRSRRSDDD